jgi:protein-disulfide isomerase
MPLETIHKLAFKAALATQCAADQGKFWEMHDQLFQNQRALEPWSAHAEAIGLDVASFETCMNGEEKAAAVRRDMAEAKKAGVTGTPSFILAETDPDDPSKVKGISFLRGARPFNFFKAEIDKAMNQSEQ